VGLHTGADVTIRLKPAPPDFGIRFQRADLTGKPIITAHYRQVVTLFRPPPSESQVRSSAPSNT